jgi:hypothetical protein
MKKELFFLVVIIVAIVSAHTSPTTTVDRLHREIGSSATIQHGTILTALIGDKKVRQHIVSLISPIIEAFDNAGNNFTNLCLQIKSVTNEPDLQMWRLENLSVSSQFLEDYHKLQDGFSSFMATMLQGTPQEIGEEVDRVYNNRKGLMARLQSLRNVFAINEEHNEIAEMLAKVVDGEKRVILSFLFKKVKKSLKVTEQKLTDAKPQLDLIKDDPEVTAFRDVITRLDSLEKQMDLVTHFLSMRHKTIGNTFFNVFNSRSLEEDKEPKSFSKSSSHDIVYDDIIDSSWGDDPDYSWGKGF